jgi:hypothetical protein
MVSISDELKERNILKLFLMARFACATLDVGQPIDTMMKQNPTTIAEALGNGEFREFTMIDCDLPFQSEKYSDNISYEHMQLLWLTYGKRNREDWCRDGAKELKNQT